MTDVARFLDPAASDLLAAAPKPRRLLLLDRDGVVNVNHGHVHTQAATEWVAGVFELARAARGAGFLVVVCTNQAGIARGLYDEEQFLAYTRWVHAAFADQGAPLLATFYCPHHPSAGLQPQPCDCRKPAPGMLQAALREFAADAASSVLVGDQPSDIAAASAAGVGSALCVASGRLADSTHVLRSLLR